MNKIFVACHQGMGDHIVCNAIYRYLAQHSKLCIIPVQWKYFWQVKQMLGDLDNVFLFPILHKFSFFQTRCLIRVFEILGIKSIKLGYFEGKFRSNKFATLDSEFYRQAKLPLDFRWNEFGFLRRTEHERKLIELYGIENDDYVLVHDDEFRGWRINQTKINPQKRVVRVQNLEGYSIFDYYSIIANASEVHCIESSFAHFIDSINVGPESLYIHRYARPGVAKFAFNQISFRRDWQILVD